jgi:gentisate 1,2-dioxygenase
MPDTSEIQSSNAEKTEFLKGLKLRKVEPLWTMMSAMVPPVPQPKASPAVWEYKELRPLLTNAGRLVHAEESERILMLVNLSLQFSLIHHYLRI